MIFIEPDKVKLSYAPSAYGGVVNYREKYYKF